MDYFICYVVNRCQYVELRSGTGTYFIVKEKLRMCFSGFIIKYALLLKVYEGL